MQYQRTFAPELSARTSSALVVDDDDGGGGGGGRAQRSYGTFASLQSEQQYGLRYTEAQLQRLRSRTERSDSAARRGNITSTAIRGDRLAAVPSYNDFARLFQTQARLVIQNTRDPNKDYAVELAWPRITDDPNHPLAQLCSRAATRTARSADPVDDLASLPQTTYTGWIEIAFRVQRAQTKTESAEQAAQTRALFFRNGLELQALLSASQLVLQFEVVRLGAAAEDAKWNTGTLWIQNPRVLPFAYLEPSAARAVDADDRDDVATAADGFARYTRKGLYKRSSRASRGLGSIRRAKRRQVQRWHDEADGGDGDATDSTTTF
jgi:hypothetical protein